MIEYTVKVYDNGDVMWFMDDELHREGGPAVEHVSGGKEWYRYGKCHREDGPACEWVNGDKEWYLNNKKLTEAEHAEKTNPAVEMTVEQICEALGKKVKVVE
jgi:hypothetical protein